MDDHGPHRSLLTLRWVLAALTAALSVALIARGTVLIGLLIGALAAVRIVMLVTWTRRRGELARRFPRRLPDQR